MEIAPASALYVMDASALTARVRREPGAAVVDGLFRNVNASLLAHAVNVCEVYYDTLRDASKTQSPPDALQVAENTLQALYVSGLQVRADMDDAFWRQVGQFKVSPGKMSLADCFVLALSVRTGATLVTGDHEFDPVAASSLCPVLFIR